MLFDPSILVRNKNEMGKQLLLDLIGWAYLEPEERDHLKYVFAEYFNFDDFLGLASSLTFFARQFNQDDGGRPLFSRARRHALQSRLWDYDPENVQTDFPELDFRHKLDDIVKWWGANVDLYSERRQPGSMDIEPEIVKQIFAGYFADWRGLQGLLNLMGTSSRLSDPEFGYGVPQAKTLDLLGFELLKHGYHQIKENYQQRLRDPLQGTVFDEYFIDLYLQRTDLVQIGRYCSELLAEDPTYLKPIEAVVVDASNSLVRARNLLWHAGEVLGGDKEFFLPSGYKAGDPRWNHDRIESAAAQLLRAVYESGIFEIAQDVIAYHEDFPDYPIGEGSDALHSLKPFAPEILIPQEEGLALKDIYLAAVDASRGPIRARRLCEHVISFVNPEWESDLNRYDPAYYPSQELMEELAADTVSRLYDHQDCLTNYRQARLDL